MNEPLIPSTVVVSRFPVSSELFRTPVVLLTQASVLDDLTDLSLTLETLLRQPGVEPKNVIVFYNHSCCSPTRHLVDLFGFMSIAYSDSQEGDGTFDQLKDSLMTAQLLFPEANQLILLESHLILAPDFLPFFGQMIPVLSDPASGVQAVTAWNENGFEETAADAGLVWRAHSADYPPRFAVLIKRLQSFDGFTSHSSGGVSWSFQRRSSVPFIDERTGAADVLFPDVSRVSLMVPSLEANVREREVHAFVRRFLSRARSVNTDEDARITNINAVANRSSLEYDIRTAVSRSPAFSVAQAVALLPSLSQHAASDASSNQLNERS